MRQGEKHRYYYTFLGEYPTEPIMECGFNLDKPYNNDTIETFKKSMEDSLNYNGCIDGTGYDMDDLTFKEASDEEVIAYYSDSLEIGTTVSINTDSRLEVGTISSKPFNNGLDVVITANMDSGDSYTGWCEEFTAEYSQ